jgi:glycosyltransferase involved in cell wall biosynthesis
MKIAFYAPLKSPNHPVPSGDRLMARLIIAALRRMGHHVDVASELRSFMPAPEGLLRTEVFAMAQREAGRLRVQWRSGATPDLWFTYHPYYKTPDLIGPELAAEFAIPYVTAEASYGRRHDLDGWADNQRLIAAAVRQAAVNICFTERDRAGLAEVTPEGCYERLLPFIDTGALTRGPAGPHGNRLVTVAMMRRGDKFDSYTMLAEALALIAERDWHLTVIGDGPMRGEVHGLFAGFGAGRIDWLGERSASDIADVLRTGGIYVWPGCGEAYGLAYLEAQAAGLPVVAQATAGVPEVVRDGATGILTPAGDRQAFADAVAHLLADGRMQQDMGGAAHRFVHDERSLAAAAERLDIILRTHLGDSYHER